MMIKSWGSWYWQLSLAGALVIVGAVGTVGSRAIAQIRPDQTLGSESSRVTSPNPGAFQIDGGATRGTNLFHSFSQFSVPTGGMASFNNALSIQNIISRVTGSSVSNIDGLLKANGTANLFLINPNGIMFGPNARLNIGGSFLGSTASSLKFADGTNFSATAPQATPLLTVSVPIGLQFGPTPGGISVQGPGAMYDPNTGLLVNAGLSVLPEQTLALVGSGVALSGGILTTDGGRIELGSVAGQSLVSLTPTNKGFSLGYGSVPTFAEIHLSGAAVVNASGSGGGDVQVQGSQVRLTDGSQIDANTLGSAPGGTLVVRASDLVEAIGTSVDGSLSSGLNALVYPEATGSGGNITLQTRRLIVQDGAQIQAATLGMGAGGNLAVRALDSVNLSGAVPAVTENDQPFPSGLVTSVYSNATGAGGNLTLQTRRLIIQDGAQIATSTFGPGKAGDLMVTASDSVELSGNVPNPKQGNVISSGLFTSVQKDATGAGGNLILQTGQLIVRDAAQIQAATFGPGNAGNLNVTASSVNLSGATAVGNIPFPSGLFTTSLGGDSGGQAGELNVEARSIRLDNRATINAATGTGKGGNINLRSGDLVLRRGSNITTNATGNATGGNITLNTGVLAALENSDISANAQESFGGRVSVNAQGIFGTQFRQQYTPLSDITATSALGPQFSGTVQINTSFVDPTRGLVTLPAELADASKLIAQRCSAGGKSVASNEFIITGRGGLPPNPSQPLSSDAVLTNWATLNPGVENRSRSAHATNPSSPPPTQIVEATGWVFGPNGEVTLTAQAPSATLQIPWLTPTTCHGS